jgi:hypothetical protein
MVMGGDWTALSKYRTAAFRGPMLGMCKMIAETRSAVGTATVVASNFE